MEKSFRSRADGFRSQFSLAIISTAALGVALTITLGFTGAIWSDASEAVRNLLLDANETLFFSLRVLLFSLPLTYFIFERMNFRLLKGMNYAAAAIAYWSMFYSGSSILSALEKGIDTRANGEGFIFAHMYTGLLVVIISVLIIFTSEKKPENTEKFSD